MLPYIRCKRIMLAWHAQLEGGEATSESAPSFKPRARLLMRW